MVTQVEIAAYNYASFQGGDSDLLGFHSVLPVGSTAPDLTATRLDTGQPVQLQEYWQEHDLLVECGVRFPDLTLLHAGGASHGIPGLGVRG